MSSPGFSAVVTGDGRIVHLLHASGRTLETLEGHHLEDLVAPDEWAAVRSLLEEAGRGGAGYGVEVSIDLGFGPDGFLVSAVQYGDVTLLTGVATAETAERFAERAPPPSDQASVVRRLTREINDASQSRSPPATPIYDQLMAVNNDMMTMQRELALSNAKLKRMNDEKNLILGTVAHDLRNPLGVVKAFSQLMVAGRAGKLEERQRDYLERIERTSAFMLTMGEDLLDFSSIEAGHVRLTPVTFDARDVLREDLALLAPIAAAKEIGVSLDLGDVPLELHADRRKFGQVITNLVDNAIKYSPVGSEVRVTAARTNDNIEVRVIDQGVGIAADEVSSLFVPFGRVSSAGTAGEKSTGLGLAIVSRIIEAHGGSILVDSNPGEGTEFSVTLPADSSQRDPG